MDWCERGVHKSIESGIIIVLLLAPAGHTHRCRSSSTIPQIVRFHSLLDTKKTVEEI